jgi:hypothetical protein
LLLKRFRQFLKVIVDTLQWPTWADLRTIGNSSAVRAAIVVPVIGYIIILNSTVADYGMAHSDDDTFCAWIRVAMHPIRNDGDPRCFRLRTGY